MICKHCNSEQVKEVIFTEEHCSPHYGEYRCESCTRQLGFIRKPENMDKRFDNNNSWTKQWKGKGIMFCAICGIKEGDLSGVRFECDHIQQLEDGGEDIFANTMMLCNNCHVEKTIRWKRTKRWREVKGGMSK